MRRIVLTAAVGAVCLLGVSIGLSQAEPPALTVPPSGAIPVPAPPAPQPKTRPAKGSFDFDFDIPSNGVYLHPVAPPPLLPGQFLSIAQATAPTEKMTVKVYSVPDLVTTIHDRTLPTTPAGDPDIAAAMKQVQAQIQLQLAAAASASAPQVADEVTKKLERLKKALLVAAPKKSWTEGGGDGEIEVYPEGLCLIVRQTSAAHEAVEDLLTQLRATQGVQIELAVEMLGFEGLQEQSEVEILKFLNRDLNAEELEQFRKCGGKTMLKNVLRLANGRSSGGSVIPGLPMQFTALAAADGSAVDFRIDLLLSAEDAADMEGMAEALAQARTVATGKTQGFIASHEGKGVAVLLVTPKVIARSAGAKK